MTNRMRQSIALGLRRVVAIAMAIAALSFAGASPALAYAPVDIVHTEHVRVGPYYLTVGFSVWPLRAMKSLDFTFMPDSGIGGKSGTLTMTGPGVKEDDRVGPLVRHPRKPDTWGLDVKAFNAPGTYSLGFVIDGPQGRGSGTLDGVTVLDQPGPPLVFSWIVGCLPLIGLLVLIGVAWRRTAPGRQLLTL